MVDTVLGKKPGPGVSPASAFLDRVPARSGEHVEIYLLGLGSLGRYIQFIEDAVVRDPGSDLSQLTAEWRAAITHYQQLEVGEAGIALQGSHRELDPEFMPLATGLRSQPSFRRTFDILPTSFGMVELDSLIVHQPSVTANVIDAMTARLGPAPTAEALFHFCLPVEAPAPPVRIERIGARRFIFSSESSQLEAGQPLVLPVDQADCPPGLVTVAGMVGFGVGFGANFLNVVRVGRRHLLNNGYHRVCALRALGVTHAPCVIQQATHVDDLQVAVGRRVAADAAYYLESARPPLLRDFFNPQLRKLLPVRRAVRRIEVNFEVSDHLSYE